MSKIIVIDDWEDAVVFTCYSTWCRKVDWSSKRVAWHRSIYSVNHIGSDPKDHREFVLFDLKFMVIYEFYVCASLLQASLIFCSTKQSV